MRANPLTIGPWDYVIAFGRNGNVAFSGRKQYSNQIYLFERKEELERDGEKFRLCAEMTTLTVAEIEEIIVEGRRRARVKEATPRILLRYRDNERGIIDTRQEDGERLDTEGVFGEAEESRGTSVACSDNAVRAREDETSAVYDMPNGGSAQPRRPYRSGIRHRRPSPRILEQDCKAV